MESCDSLRLLAESLTDISSTTANANQQTNDLMQGNRTIKRSRLGQSWLAIAIALLLLAGQAAIATHAVADTVNGVTDSCEFCHQLDRQQQVLGGEIQLLQFQRPLEAIAIHVVPTFLQLTVLQPVARGPPLS
jgi:hypothetical protein